MWSLQYLKETSFNLGGFFSGWKKVFSIPQLKKEHLSANYDGLSSKSEGEVLVLKNTILLRPVFPSYILFQCYKDF